MPSVSSLKYYLKYGYSTFMAHIVNHGKFYRIEVPSACQSYSTHRPPIENQKCDVIGPPHSVSNLRPFHFHIPENEAPIEKEFRLKRQEVQQWNQEFWTNHNARFIKERKEFIVANQPVNSENPLSADEMSVFYKSFLDKNWKTHLNYNFEWYKRNAQLVVLHLRAKLSRFSQNFSQRKKTSEDCQKK